MQAEGHPRGGNSKPIAEMARSRRDPERARPGIAHDLQDIAATGLIFGALWSTVSASLIGLAVGVAAGYTVALALGESRRAAAVMMVYIDGVNAVPRVALFPLIVILVGFGPMSKIIGAVIVVFFIIFLV